MKSTILLVFMIVALATQAQVDLSKMNSFLAKKDTVKALNTINKLIDKNPQSALLYLERAKIKIARKDFEPAMVDLNSFCSLNKKCGEATFYKGLVRYKLGDFNGAIGFFSESSSNEKDINTWLYLGLSHMKLENYNLALNIFDRVLGMDSQHEIAMYNGALAHYYDGNFKKASELFTQYIRTHTNDESAMLGNALSLAMNKKYDKSNEQLERILQLNPQNDVAKYNLGLNHYNADAMDKACQAWREASALGNESATLALDQFCGK